ncbi:hypothetical protein KQI03_12135 [Levilactobacillus brevis]|uniref:hypothetical protein n=1 Tax=Levilactobacillus brevis TaxID=1580 RepID=UPI001C0F838D|nr:hypothetical protein [Levilactobacillus brevis]MBU5275370.1 hypothetical protein [Levilactobacillus brevis]
MNKEEIDPQKEIEFCVAVMKGKGLPINLNTLLFGIISDYAGDWTYFDELAHNIADKLQGDELTDDEIMTTINRFKDYVEAQHDTRTD